MINRLDWINDGSELLISAYSGIWVWDANMMSSTRLITAECDMAQPKDDLVFLFFYNHDGKPESWIDVVDAKTFKSRFRCDAEFRLWPVVYSVAANDWFAAIDLQNGDYWEGHSCIYVWDKYTGKLMHKHNIAKPCLDMAINPNQPQQFALFTFYGEVLLMDSVNGSIIDSWQSNISYERGHNPRFDWNDAGIVIWCHDDYTDDNEIHLAVWDLESDAKHIEKLDAKEFDQYRSVGLMTPDKLIAEYLEGDQTQLRIWNPATNEIKQVFTMDDDDFCPYAIHPDEKHIAIAQGDEIRLYELETGQLIHSITIPEATLDQ